MKLSHAPLLSGIQSILCGAVQAMHMTDLKVHHRYVPKQVQYLNYAAAASEVSIPGHLNAVLNMFGSI